MSGPERVLVLVLWSFSSPDAAGLAEELGRIRSSVMGPSGLLLLVGLPACGEPSCARTWSRLAS